MDQPTIEGLATDAAVPSSTEVVQASGLVLACASSGDAVTLTTAVTKMCETHGVDPLGMQTQLDVTDRDSITASTAVRYARALHATQLAVARLVAQGVIVAVQPNEEGSRRAISVPFRAAHGSTTTEGSVTVWVADVVVPAAFRLTPGTSKSGDVPLLTVEKWSEGVGPLLTGRLPRLLDEALAAYRRGQYLSAATLLGSVTEGAWTRSGEMLRGMTTKLDKALDDDRIADVQARIAELFKANKIRTAEDLSTFATYIRVIRNYGIHPNVTENRAAEEAFTEVGCFSLVQRTHAHLLALLAGVQKVHQTASSSREEASTSNQAPARGH